MWMKNGSLLVYGILLRKETNGYAFFLVGNWLVLTKIESLFVYKVWLRK